jgi:hypothetical protein
MTERMLVRRRAGNLWRNKGLISTGAASRANTEPTQCRMKLGRDDLGGGMHSDTRSAYDHVQ